MRSLANAGAASPADAGMMTLVDPAGSVAGGVTDLNMPVRERTERVTFLREGVVRICSVLDGSVYCDGEMDYVDCVWPDAWCQEMPKICDDLHCHLLTMWAATRTV